MNDGCMSIDIIDQYRPSRLQGYNAKLHQFINISVFLRPDDVAPKNYYYFKKILSPRNSQFLAGYCQ